jgi:uncharacterized protein
MTNTDIPDISIIIPALQEGVSIQQTLQHLQERVRDHLYEVIVVDGDPQGSTLKHLPLESNPVKGIIAPPGRGTQMNVGVQAARGNILLFLHADVRLPKTAFPQILSLLESDAIAGGAFDFRIDSPRRLLAIISHISSWRSHLTRIPYGDQAIFVRRSIFAAVGGYPQEPLMEDVGLMQRLKQHHYQIEFIRDPVIISPRRWEKEGIWRCTLRNWLLISLYYGGVSPQQLAQWYPPHRVNP